MEITVAIEASPSVADWLEAVGTIAAAVIALTIALAAWLGELRRRGQSAWATLYLVEAATQRFMQFLSRLKDALDPSGTLSTNRAQILLPSGVLNELNAIFDELRPTDMPTRGTADAYVNLRIAVRDLQASIEFVAARPGSAITIPLAQLWANTSQTFGAINEARARFAHPLWPEWLLNWRARRLSIARERIARADAAKAKAEHH